MYKYVSMGISLLYYGLKVYAAGIDVYGLDQTAAAQLLKQWGKPIYETEKSYWALRLEKKLTPQKEQEWQKKQLDYIEGIKHTYAYQTVLIESVYYPGSKGLFTTIGLDKAPSYQQKVAAYQAKNPPDVLDKLWLFIPKATQFIIEHPEYANALNCLDYHCITPEHAYFKADLSYFRHEVQLKKNMILQTHGAQPINIIKRKKKKISIFFFSTCTICLFLIRKKKNKTKKICFLFFFFYYYLIFNQKLRTHVSLKYYYK